jgi:hypothetical protein
MPHTLATIPSSLLTYFLAFFSVFLAITF